jgi:dipeptidyl aminopeptidase/acylaminoacyl peptidase
MPLRLLALVVPFAFIVAAPSDASAPASKGRLVLVSEAQGIAAVEVIGDTGKPIVISYGIGIHGTAAVAPAGTRAAIVTTVQPPGPFPITIPALLVADFVHGGLTLVAGDVGGRPTWSPDGTKLVFASKRDGDWDLYEVDADEENAPDPTNLTPASPAADTNPRWSPDGSTIAFDSDRGGNQDVYELNPDGSNVRAVTSDPAADSMGDWSPDSRNLVFTSMRTGNGDLYIVPATGGSATRLTSGSGAETHAAWSPEGTTIAYSSDADGDNEAYEIAADGTGLRRVTDNTVEDLVQDWQPVHDLVRPTAKALPSQSRRGRPVLIRYRLAENMALVKVFSRWSYRTRYGGAAGEGFGVVASTPGGRLYTERLPSSVFRNAPSRFRFCVQAQDASLNESAVSCAIYRFLPKAKTKTKRR